MLLNKTIEQYQPTHISLHLFFNICFELQFIGITCEHRSSYYKIKNTQKDYTFNIASTLCYHTYTHTPTLNCLTINF